VALYNNSLNYGSVAKCFHWVLGIAIVGMLCGGFYMVDLEDSPISRNLYFFHKSVGVTILVLTVIRFLWRFMNKTTPRLTLNNFLHIIGKINIYLMYLLTFVMTFSGFTMSMAGGHGINWFNVYKIPMIIGKDTSLAKLAMEIHEFSGVALAILVVMHILAALVHHFIFRDRVLIGMLPRFSSR
jgi:cytochrome b561